MLLDLAQQIKRDEYKPEVIVGVSRGGWPPARVMSDLLQNPNLAVQHESMLNELQEVGQHDNVATRIQPVATSKQPVLIHDHDIHHHEEVEESLNIMDKEKELIVKALKKHKGKRKDASSDLGISERTLYRKLKEYDISE